MKMQFATRLVAALLFVGTSAQAATIFEIPVTAQRMSFTASGVLGGGDHLLQILTEAGGHLTLKCKGEIESSFLMVDLASPHVTNAKFSMKVSAQTATMDECRRHVLELRKNILKGDSKVRIEIDLDQLINIATKK